MRANYARIREEVGDGVTVVAATKYVSVPDMAVLAEAGVEVVGENRAQDLERKHAEYGDAFRWHFIGHLQSNKVKVVNRICELVHSLDSESAARKLGVAALKAETDKLEQLLEANTDLTRQDKELTEQVASLTREIHTLLSARGTS